MICVALDGGRVLDIAFMPGGWSEFDTNVSDHRPVVRKCR